MLKLNTPQIKVVMDSAKDFEKHILQEAIKCLLEHEHHNDITHTRPFMAQLLIDNKILVDDPSLNVKCTQEPTAENWANTEATTEWTYQEDIRDIRNLYAGLLDTSLDSALKQIMELKITDSNIRISMHPNFAFDTRRMEFAPIDSECNPDDPNNHTRMYVSQSQSLIGFLSFLETNKANGKTNPSKIVLIVNNNTNGIFSKDGYVRYVYVPDDNAYYQPTTEGTDNHGTVVVDPKTGTIHQTYKIPVQGTIKTKAAKRPNHNDGSDGN